MENIIDIDSNFNFNDITLDNPYPLQGGNFYTKISYSLKKLPLHLQLPKCKTKNGIVRNVSSRKSYCDLMFSVYDTTIISWMENLENRCRDRENRENRDRVADRRETSTEKRNQTDRPAIAS